MMKPAWPWRQAYGNGSCVRHFRPEVFAKLPAKTLQKYADACQTDIEGLKKPE